MPLLPLLVALTLAQDSTDWRGFRGTDGTASSDAVLPVSFGDDQNLAWRAALPGPGSSSPVVVDGRVFVTCWTGYGLDREEPGTPADLRRHLLCFDAETGTPRWSREVGAVQGDDAFGGRMASHGYASSTPVSDGETVFVFFGKAGVHAFSLDGEPRWHTTVGDRSSEWLTGSGSSLGLWRDVLLVNASDERQALIALDRHTGKELWARGGPELDQAYATPTVVEHDDRAVVVFPYLENVLGLDPQSGDVVWRVKTPTNGALAPTVVVGDGVVYSFGGQSGTRSLCVRLDGDGDVTDSHVEWSSRHGAYVSTPVLVGEHLFWADEGGFAYCLHTLDGELIYKERLEGSFYASMVHAGGRLYVASRQGTIFVLPAEPRFEVLASNRFSADDSTFDGTAAVSDGRLFLRSHANLYCVQAEPADGGGERSARHR